MEFNIIYTDEYDYTKTTRVIGDNLRVNNQGYLLVEIIHDRLVDYKQGMDELDNVEYKMLTRAIFKNWDYAIPVPTSPPKSGMSISNK